MHRKSIDEESGDRRPVEWNWNGTWVERFDDAVKVCKQTCDRDRICNSFNIQRIEFGAGYTCSFYQSMLDNKNCLGVPGGMSDVETTYMKTGIGMCERFADRLYSHYTEKEKEERKDDLRLKIESCCSEN